MKHMVVDDFRKGKGFKPKTRTVKQLRDLQRMKTLTSRPGSTSTTSSRSSKGKNRPPSVSAQFNVSHLTHHKQYIVVDELTDGVVCE